MTGRKQPSPRDDILALFGGQRPQRLPCFSGLISVTAPGLTSLDYRLSEVHGDPDKMARAAASSYRQFGLGAVSLPLDMCVEAEMLGARVNFQADEDLPLLPVVAGAAASSPGDLSLPAPSSVRQRGRVPLVVEAIGRLKADVGDEAAVGAWVPGPFTLAMLLVDPGLLVPAVVEQPQGVARLLDALVDILAEVALAYHEAGADFLTLHEMGGSPGYLGPPTFEKLVLPRLRRLLEALPSPRVLSVCGNTNNAVSLLAGAGADAISVDQLNNLERSREALGPEVLLFGNVDPVGTLAFGSEDDVRRAVQSAVDAGVDAIWPGCDLWPDTPAANLRALVDAAKDAVRRAG